MNSQVTFTPRPENYAGTLIERSRNIGAFVVRRVGAATAADSVTDLFSRRSDYATAIGDVAAALYSLALRDPLANKVRALTDKERQECQIDSFRSGTVPVVAFVNHSLLLAHGRVAVGEERDVRVWGPAGLLGLQAVLLRVGQNTIAEDYGKSHASLLGLVFRRPDSPLQSQQGFALLEVNCAGDVKGRVCRPRPVLADEFMRSQLGMADAQVCTSSDTVTCSVEQALAFPDCNNYLADNLSGLARYLYAVAHMRPV